MVLHYSTTPTMCHLTIPVCAKERHTTQRVIYGMIQLQIGSVLTSKTEGISFSVAQSCQILTRTALQSPSVVGGSTLLGRNSIAVYVATRKCAEY